MPANNQPAKELISKYQQGTCTPEEQVIVEAWYATWNEREDNLSEEQLAVAEERVFQRLPKAPQPGKTRTLWPRIAAAASIIIACSVGGYFVLHQTQQQQVAQVQDIKPGRNQATLTLANGQKIILTKSLNGSLAQQGGTAIQVNAGTALTYTTNSATSEVQYNTLSTARGEQSPYVLVLADGTKVWLNAASSITYPVAFDGKDRGVKITGEAYFEVVHNAAQPFKVVANGQTVEDIGTHFNVSAYSDEVIIKTTLLEGSVRVSMANQKEVLAKSGQQALVANNIIKTRTVDVDETMAWKNGYFDFGGDDLEGVMHKISRWYNVDIEFTDNSLKKQVFGGTVSRFKNVSQVLKKLELTKTVHFKIDGKKIIVTP